MYTLFEKVRKLQNVETTVFKICLIWKQSAEQRAILADKFQEEVASFLHPYTGLSKVTEQRQ